MRLFPDDAWAVATIWQEARGESMEGKIAVGRVIRNRMRMRYSSDGTVPGTVLKAYQFSGWNHNDPNRIPAARLDDDDPVVRQCQEAWIRPATEDAGVEDAVLYYAPKGVVQKPSWAHDENFVTQVDHHIFFRG